MSFYPRAATTAGAVDEAAPPRKERNPVAAGSCSSKKRSSGALNAPCAQINATPTIIAETRTDPTSVRKITKMLNRIKHPSVSRSENVRPRMTIG